MPSDNKPRYNLNCIKTTSIGIGLGSSELRQLLGLPASHIQALDSVPSVILRIQLPAKDAAKQHMISARP